ncbi:MAG: aminoglycoside phosphotransferase family protein [Clostridia bacterium]|nr:aminoglycoside phosphotransferase family protein [Clostridia bacterium]
MKNDLNLAVSALNHFQITGTLRGCAPYGNGHINDTFCAFTEDAHSKRRRYILQAINQTVFSRPDKVMENIEGVIEHLHTKTDDPRAVMTLVPTVDGHAFYTDENGGCWRLYDFVEDSLCLERPESNEDFYQSALAFGQFQRDLSDFPAENLNETIPNFHNTPVRYQRFLEAVKADKCGRAKDVADEIRFVTDRADFYSVLLDAHKAGELPLRVSHNDTKINNVLLDADTRSALCVIDLDTIMPGFSVTDFGDSIRFGASTAAEDEKDLSKVWMDLELFKTYTAGFLAGCGGSLPNSEILLLPEGAKMMTIECGMRFLTDYLEGDTYFRIHYPTHNLDRCRTQFKLVADMEEKWDDMKAAVANYCR